MLESRLTPSMRLLANLLESRTGQVLSDGRIWRLETSLRPILKAHGLTSLDALASGVQGNPDGALAQASINALLNNETSFFRDPHLFSLITTGLLPQMMKRAVEERRDKRLRIWCAGCSTGQEAYSLAMAFQNNKAQWPDWNVQIVATDISTSAIERAKSGLFPQMDVQRGLPIADLLRWCEPEGEQWRISDSLRAMVDFRVGNLFDDKAAAGFFDLILCRNVLLYFSTRRKRQLLQILSRHSHGGGYLMLGAGEAVIDHSREFCASRQFRGLYERVDPLAFDASI